MTEHERATVKVKPLEWNPYRAETPFGWYEINDQRDVPEGDLKGRMPFLLCGSRLDYSRHATLEAARAAAQADYEARILSALTPQAGDNADVEDRALLIARNTLKNEARRAGPLTIGEIDDVFARLNRTVFSHPCTSTPVVSQNAPALEDKGGDAFAQIVAARKVVIDATAAYNARLAVARAERDRGNWSIKVDPEYHAMCDAQSAFHRTVQDLADAALSPEPEAAP